MVSVLIMKKLIENTIPRKWGSFVCICGKQISIHNKVRHLKTHSHWVKSTKYCLKCGCRLLDNERGKFETCNSHRHLDSDKRFLILGYLD